MAEAVWEAVTGRPWTKVTSSAATSTTPAGSAGRADDSHNRSSASYRCVNLPRIRFSVLCGEDDNEKDVIVLG